MGNIYKDLKLSNEKEIKANMNIEKLNQTEGDLIFKSKKTMTDFGYANAFKKDKRVDILRDRC